jgi:hypothetical protein
MPPPATAALAAAMILSGTINTIATKLQDTTVVSGGGGDGGDPAVLFFHPAVQSAFMFLGEALCLGGAAVSAARRRRSATAAAGAERRVSRHRATPAAILAFALPAACDAAATTLLNVGLAMTSASTFQMLRGTLVGWAGLFTQVLLRRRLRAHHWFGVVLIAAGAAVVGAASIVYEGGEGGGEGGEGGGGRVSSVVGAHRHPPAVPAAASSPTAPLSAPAMGVALVIASQALTALQFIVEEAFLARHRLPALLAVGLEGAWGLGLCAAALPALAALRGPGGRPLDDWRAGLAAIAASPRLAGSTALTVASIAAFNACGLAVTKRLSGAGRAATDAVRTLAVWGAALAAGWEVFNPGGPLKVLGFGLLLTGSALFNGLVAACLPSSGGGEDAAGEGDEADPLLVEDGGGGTTTAAATATAAAPAAPAATAPVQARRPRAAPHYTLARSARLAPSALEPHSLLDATPSGGFGSSVGGGSAMDSEVDVSGHGGRRAGDALLEGRRREGGGV